MSRAPTGRRATGLVTWLAIAVLLLPFVPLLLAAVAGRWRYPSLLPGSTTARGMRLLTQPGTDAVHGLLLSGGIAAAVSVVAVLIGLPAGRALALHRFRGRRLVQFLLLAPVLVPGLAVTLGLQVFFVRVGLSGTIAGVVLVHLMPTVPYASTILAGGFANLEQDYERQARVLGAGPVEVLTLVTLPLIRPALVTAALLTFLISWSEYVLTLLVGGGQVQTLPLLLFAAIGSSDTTAAAALALVLVLPPLLLVAAAARTLAGAGGPSVGLART